MLVTSRCGNKLPLWKQLGEGNQRGDNGLEVWSNVGWAFIYL
jgi:hypothetical protein